MSGVLIELPFPPASLSGHNTGHWRSKSGIVAKHREWARLATLAANATVPDSGDIRLSITFYPPDRRGDRCNYPNRMKPALDGIAQALGVNDKRFLPSYHFAEPTKTPRVIVAIADRNPKGGDVQQAPSRSDESGGARSAIAQKAAPLTSPYRRNAR